MNFQDDLKAQRLKLIRAALLELNKYPEIIGSENTLDYPKSKIEIAYCKLLWQIDEEIRRLVKGE